VSGDTLAQLLQGVLHLTPGALVMLVVGLLLVYLAVAKEYEPMLLLRSAPAACSRTCPSRR